LGAAIKKSKEAQGQTAFPEGLARARKFDDELPKEGGPRKLKSAEQILCPGAAKMRGALASKKKEGQSGRSKFYYVEQVEEGRSRQGNGSRLIWAPRGFRPVAG